MEAFSDGVFAIAITLLILEVHVPDSRDGRLWHDLLHSWPSFASFGVSFLVIGIIWVNHHAVFQHIRRADRTLLFLNLGLLMSVSFLPFPTALLARYVRADDSNAHVAAFVYSLTMTFMSIMWSTLWWHATHHEDLLEESLTHEEAHSLMRLTVLGGLIYAATMAIAWISAPATLATFAVLALYWIVIYRPEVRRPGSLAQE